MKTVVISTGTIKVNFGALVKEFITSNELVTTVNGICLITSHKVAAVVEWSIKNTIIRTKIRKNTLYNRPFLLRTILVRSAVLNRG